MRRILVFLPSLAAMAFVAFSGCEAAPIAPLGTAADAALPPVDAAPASVDANAALADASDSSEPIESAAPDGGSPSTCACSGRDRCCLPEAPTVCVDGTNDEMCGSESELCSMCGPSEGCRPTDGGLRCVPVLGAGSPCTAAQDCKSRLCLDGACAGDGSCLSGGAPCGPGHVGHCCSGLLCMDNCCAPAGASIAPGSNTLCCPGLTMYQMPGSNVRTCGAP